MKCLGMVFVAVVAAAGFALADTGEVAIPSPEIGESITLSVPPDPCGKPDTLALIHAFKYHEAGFNDTDVLGFLEAILRSVADSSSVALISHGSNCIDTEWCDSNECLWDIHACQVGAAWDVVTTLLGCGICLP